jgi:ssDNA-binding Zn-finger/Zn-ribbon topoisomerase 1
MKLLKSKFKNPYFWGCSNYPACSGRHSAHPDGTPMGIPTDAETRKMRIKAHEAFDQLWKKWGYTRNESYQLLQTILRMTKDQAHIANFNKEQCEDLIKKIEQIEFGELKI